VKQMVTRLPVAAPLRGCSTVRCTKLATYIVRVEEHDRCGLNGKQMAYLELYCTQCMNQWWRAGTHSVTDWFPITMEWLRAYDLGYCTILGAEEAEEHEADAEAS
jgi:hypothetical protein